MKGKNKLVPRLLGITKESVMRVDEKTKEVIQEWNLTNIKRWAASPKSFTLVSSSQRDKRLFHPTAGTPQEHEEGAPGRGFCCLSPPPGLRSTPLRGILSCGQVRVRGGRSGLVAPP